MLPVPLVECHGIESRLTEEDTLHHIRIASGQVGHPCGRGRITPSSLGLVTAVPSHFVAPDLVVLSVGIRETDVVAVKVLVLPVTDKPDERSKGAHRFIRQSPLFEDGRNLIVIYRLHLIPGAVEGGMIPD